jgi:hypothetical protein
VRGLLKWLGVGKFYLFIDMSKSTHKLTTKQKDQILTMLAARETYADIAKEAGCTWSNIDYYAKKFSKQINTLQTEHDARNINRGLRSKEKRIERLERLARRIEASIENEDDGGFGLWPKDVKLAGNGKEVPVRVFAGEAVRQYRAILDDIAKEYGERSTKQDVTLRFDQMSDADLIRFITRETGSSSGS